MERSSDRRKSSLQRCVRGAVTWHSETDLTVSRQEMGPSVLPRLAVRSWAHAVLLPQPPKQLGRQDVLSQGEAVTSSKGSLNISILSAHALEDVI